MEAIHIDCFPFPPGKTLRKWICLTEHCVLSQWISESDYTHGKRKTLLWFLLWVFKVAHKFFQVIWPCTLFLISSPLVLLFPYPACSGSMVFALFIPFVWFFLFISFVCYLYVTLSVRCFPFTPVEGALGSKIIHLYLNPSCPFTYFLFLSLTPKSMYHTILQAGMHFFGRG